MDALSEHSAVTPHLATGLLLTPIPAREPSGHPRGVQELGGGGVPATPSPLTSKCPRWKRAAERLAKHTDTSGLPGSSWDAACGDRRAASSRGDPPPGPPPRGSPQGGLPRPTYLRVEPGGGRVTAAAERSVSLLAVETRGRRLLARARPAAQPPQSRRLRLGPAGHGVSSAYRPAPFRSSPPSLSLSLPAAHRRRPQPRRSVSCSDAAASRSRSAGSSAAQRRAAHSRHSSTGSSITSTPMAAPSSAGPGALPPYGTEQPIGAL